MKRPLAGVKPDANMENKQEHLFTTPRREVVQNTTHLTPSIKIKNKNKNLYELQSPEGV
jgi:hypothetical protein